MDYTTLKIKHPVAASLLRLQTPQSFHGYMGQLYFFFEDGDVIADGEALPEPMILKACSKVWLWESSSEDFVVY